MPDGHVRALLETRAPLAAVPGCPELVAHQAADVFALWQALERMRGVQISDVPFWALVWPAAAALARWLLDHTDAVRDRRVLELGSGGAVAAIAAARAGAADVIANDIDPDCAVVASANAAANDVGLTCESTDRIARGELGEVDLVLVADGFYERPVAEQTLELLRRARGDGCDVIIADSGRPFAPSREELEILCEVEQPALEAVEGVTTRHVVVGRLRR